MLFGEDSSEQSINSLSRFEKQESRPSTYTDFSGKFKLESLGFSTVVYEVLRSFIRFEGKKKSP